jgi:hypothetical protein
VTLVGGQLEQRHVLEEAAQELAVVLHGRVEVGRADVVRLGQVAKVVRLRRGRLFGRGGPVAVVVERGQTCVDGGGPEDSF